MRYSPFQWQSLSQWVPLSLLCHVYVFTKTYLVYLYFYLAPHLDIYRIMALRWWEGQELGLRLRLGGVDHARQTTVNIKSPHILRQCFKIFKIFIPIENSRIFIPIFRVFKYIYTEFICKDIFTIVVWVLTRQLIVLCQSLIVKLRKVSSRLWPGHDLTLGWLDQNTAIGVG